MISVLIDASLIDRHTTGIGNVTRSLVSGLQQHQQQNSELQYTFLVPPNHHENTGSHTHFKAVRKWQKYFPSSLPAVDIWHSTYQYYRYLRKTAHTKHIITIHDLNFLYEKTPAKAQRYLNFMQRRINAADAVVAISEFVANDIRHHLDINGKHLEVIYNAVDNLQLDKAVQPQFHSNDKPFFFTLGAIRKKKNFHVLLEMMLRFPEYQLYICGNEDCNKYLLELKTKIAELKLHNVLIVGPISKEEKVWLYQHADAFLFPSLLEGFGLPPLEAMQFGTPVFTSNMTSMPEVGGGYSVIWDNFDPDHLSQTLREQLPLLQQDHNKREEMKAYATSFSQTKNILSYVSLYKHLANT